MVIRLYQLISGINHKWMLLSDKWTQDGEWDILMINGFLTGYSGYQYG
jgi:hypothetical protein